MILNLRLFLSSCCKKRDSTSLSGFPATPAGVEDHPAQGTRTAPPLHHPVRSAEKAPPRSCPRRYSSQGSASSSPCDHGSRGGPSAGNETTKIRRSPLQKTHALLMTTPLISRDRFPLIGCKPFKVCKLRSAALLECGDHPAQTSRHPLVDKTPSIRLSSVAASRKARAKALKIPPPCGAHLYHR